MTQASDTHSKTVGYVLWVFGFTGAHRFYFGKPVTGTIWFFTFGLLGGGWLIDLFLIPAMDREADLKFRSGRINFSLAWVLLTFLGFFGVHRMYMGKWLTGILYGCYRTDGTGFYQHHGTVLDSSNLFGSLYVGTHR